MEKTYITENNNKFIVQKRKLNAAVENIIAIEAKLSDWKNGFYQALRYRYFANQSYLAIKNVYIKNIDKNNIIFLSFIKYVVPSSATAKITQTCDNK